MDGFCMKLKIFMTIISKMVMVLFFHLVGAINLVAAGKHFSEPAKALSMIGSDYKTYVLSMSKEKFVEHLNQMLELSSLRYMSLLKDPEIRARFDVCVAELGRKVAVICSRDGSLDPFMRDFSQADMPVMNPMARVSEPRGDGDVDVIPERGLRVERMVEVILLHLDRGLTIRERLIAPFRYQFEQLNHVGRFDLDLIRSLENGYLKEYIRTLILVFICLWLEKYIAVEPAMRLPYNQNAFFYYMKNTFMLSPVLLIILGFA
jgi:hypothetical protein